MSDAALQPLTIVEIQRRVASELTRIGSVIDELGARFAEAGEELALVGGPVRDAMIGRLQNDLDFTTSARPDVTERLVSGWADAVWDMGRDFGTIGCRKGPWQVDITTYRSETYDPSSRKPDVDFGDSLEGDLGRRASSAAGRRRRSPPVRRAYAGRARRGRRCRRTGRRTPARAPGPPSS